MQLCRRTQFSCRLHCGIFKQLGNVFRYFVKGLLVERYASDYPPATICAPLELDSPFQCTRNVELPAMMRLSLPVAAAQAVFTLAGIRLVACRGKSRSRQQRPQRAYRAMTICVPWFESCETSSAKVRPSSAQTVDKLSTAKTSTCASGRTSNAPVKARTKSS